MGSVRVLDVLGGGEAGSHVRSVASRTVAAYYMESLTPLPAAACRACLASSSRLLLPTLRSCERGKVSSGADTLGGWGRGYDWLRTPTQTACCP